jgi:choline dehydrogenase-like flavoprotein
MTKQDEFDYVVVGAGSAGCIVAAELADAGASVLLLEAGEPAEANPETLRSDGYKTAFVNDRLMWNRLSAPQRALDGRSVFLGSGRGVGGSGSINAMVYTRGDRLDYDEWPAGWRWDDLLPDFARLERALDVRRMAPTGFTEACIAGAEHAGFRRKDDLNDGSLCGHLGYEWMNLAGADRRSSYVAFVKSRPARPALRVATDATARRVLFDGPRAIGVEYQTETGVHVARARREVVLCAGALETPRLLLLSGVGPGDELAAHGIPQIAELPVGRNLMDHPNVSLFFLGGQATDCDRPQLYGFHRARPSSSLPPGQADTCYVFYAARSSFREGAMRMLPSMALPPPLYRVAPLRRAMMASIGVAFRAPPVRRFVERMWGIVVILGKPRSRGALRLASPDVRAPAIIDPAWLSHPDDLAALLDGIALARRIAGSPALSAWGNREIIPGARVDGAASLSRFVRKNVMTTYHYAGTCRMGDVVDERLRVQRLAGLRVADASAIPSVPVSAMNAPSMLIGYRAARFLREDAG